MQFNSPLRVLGTGFTTALFASTLFAQTLATGDPRTIVEPEYPDVCEVLQAHFSSSQRATPPASDDTSRLQAALDSCAGTGQSVMLIRGGTNDAFYSKTLSVNGEALVVKPGITLFGNNGYANELLNVSGTNPAIMGPGTIDGRGDLISGTPRLIEARNTMNFTVYNVTLTHAAKMHLYVEGGSNLTVWKLTVATPANTKNTDGIDIDSMTNATVYDSSIEDGDDGVAVKTNSGPASNITVRNNVFYGTHGMSIGSQTMYGVTNVLWEDNQMFGTDMFGNVASDNNGIRIKSDPTCGVLVQQVTYRRTILTGIKHLLIFNPYYGTCSGTPGIPVFQDIVVDGVVSTGSQSGAYSQFQGYDASHPLELYLANVNLDQTAQQKTQYANVGLYNSNITPAGPGVTTFDFYLNDLNGWPNTPH
ncbi:MAG TPA: glycosyl hydrolase family 28 protein [Terracidiphilus sp.]|nr:glycosyl hydrolase family 28 protein [Terracidiphilus sp.]